MNDELRIGDVARACGVSADTIRHYERVGVITGVRRDAGGYRRYAPEVIEHVHVIRRALSIGFTLDELAKIFRQRGSGTPPCRSVRRMAQQKLEDLDGRIETMLALRARLAETIATWDDRLATTPEGHPAHLLRL